MENQSQPELHLKLTEADLSPSFRGKAIPQAPKFFHFTRSAKEFHDATLITFTRPDGKEQVLKDTYSRRP